MLPSTEIEKSKTAIIEDSSQIWFSQFKFDGGCSDFSAFLRETERLLLSCPDILAKIDEDLERHAKSKKRLRQKDMHFEDCRTSALEGFCQVDKFNDQNPELSQGRPRIGAIVLYYFIFVRGYLGGSLRSKKSRTFISESRSLAELWRRLDQPAQSPGCISENLDAISPETIEYIWERQLAFVKSEGLDDYLKLYIDSTSVEANTSWPTD